MIVEDSSYKNVRGLLKKNFRECVIIYLVQFKHGVDFICKNHKSIEKSPIQSLK
jgi:hypothetical protein